ncbi:nitrile hydratase accessory protein [Sphaerimonospora sp. CA-214678]|uniref:nitrile hydratase accessory protein n=1 Tax=Sphaerimonospora sp. CA-214678 TaxID=3240029 RepID=UPI003D917AD5
MTAQEISLPPMSGQGAPPRQNGELVFTEPWEATAFGVAVALSNQGTYNWEHFRQRLIKAIADSGGCEAYYESWAKALEASVIDAGILPEQEILDRMAALQQPH